MIALPWVVMLEPDFLSHAYADTGKVILTWARFEQRIIIQTWWSRDPARKSPFVQGSIERGFYNRWLEWCRIFEAPDDLRRKVLALSDFRDDISHNVRAVDEGRSAYSLAVSRRNLDWRKGWQRWFDKFVHLPSRARPNPPVEQQHLHYGPDDVTRFLKNLDVAQDEAAALVEGWFNARGYNVPIIPPFPVN